MSLVDTSQWRRPVRKDFPKPHEGDVNLDDFDDVSNFITGDGRHSNREPMTTNKCRLFLDNHIANKKVVLQLEQVVNDRSVRLIYQDYDKPQLFNLIVEGLGLEVGEEADVTEPLDYFSPELVELLTLPQLTQSGDENQDIELSSEVGRVIAFVTPLIDDYRVPGFYRDQLCSVLALCYYMSTHDELPTKSVTVSRANIHPNAFPNVKLGTWLQTLRIYKKKNNTDRVNTQPKHQPPPLWLDTLLTAAGMIWEDLTNLRFLRKYHAFKDMHDVMGDEAIHYYTLEMRKWIYNWRSGMRSPDDPHFNAPSDEQQAMLTSIGVNLSETSTELKSKSNTIAMFGLVDEYCQTYGSYEIMHPLVQVYNPKFNPAYSWISGIRKRFAEGKLKEEDYEVKEFRKRGISLVKIPRTKRQLSAEAHFILELKKSLKDKGVIGGNDAVSRQVNIDEGAHSRDLDFEIELEYDNLSGDLVVMRVLGDMDEHGHVAEGYTEEKDQKRQYKAVTQCMDEDPPVNLALTLRANSTSLVMFEKGPGKMFVEKCVAIILDGIEKVKTLSPTDFRAEMHMVDYPRYHPKADENKRRILPSSNSLRAQSEDDWDTHYIWDRMCLHFSGASTGGRITPEIYLQRQQEAADAEAADAEAAGEDGDKKVAAVETGV